MKNKNRYIKSILIIVAMSIVIMFSLEYSLYNGKSLESRQRILGRNNKQLLILSEAVLDNYIISEIIDENEYYGYALFKPAGRGGYDFASSMLNHNGSMGVDFIWTDENRYEIFMCNKPNLLYGEVVYKDMDTSAKITKKFDLINETMAVIEAPDLKSYSRQVVFYDIADNKYE